MDGEALLYWNFIKAFWPLAASVAVLLILTIATYKWLFNAKENTFAHKVRNILGGMGALFVMWVVSGKLMAWAMNVEYQKVTIWATLPAFLLMLIVIIRLGGEVSPEAK